MGIFQTMNNNHNTVNLRLTQDYFIKDYTAIRNDANSLKAQKERDIYQYKDTHTPLSIDDPKLNEKYFILFGGFQHTLVSMQLGECLIFVNNFFEPFRYFDTDKDREEINILIEENKITDADIYDFLKKNNFTFMRKFLDEFEEIQESTKDGNIVAKKNVDGKPSIIWVSSKPNNSSFHPWRISIPLSIFCCKTLKYAISQLIKKTDDVAKKPQTKIFSNKKI